MNDLPPEPRLPLTVPLSLWDQMAQEMSPAFADSYLSGAQLSAGKLVPHTLTAYERLTGSRPARSLIQVLGLTLVRPEPFGGRR